MPRASHEAFMGSPLTRGGPLQETDTKPAAAAAAGPDAAAVATTTTTAAAEWDWLAEATEDISAEAAIGLLGSEQQEELLQHWLSTSAGSDPQAEASLEAFPLPLALSPPSSNAQAAAAAGAWPPGCLALSPTTSSKSPLGGLRGASKGGSLGPLSPSTASPLRTPGKSRSSNGSSSTKQLQRQQQQRQQQPEIWFAKEPPPPPEVVPWGGPGDRWILGAEETIEKREAGAQLVFHFPQSGCTYTTTAALAADAEAAASKEAFWEVTCSSSSNSSSSSESSSTGAFLLKRVALDKDSSFPAWLLHCICLAQYAAASHPSNAQQQQQQQQQAVCCSGRLLLPVFDVHIAAAAAYFVVAAWGVSLAEALQQPEAHRASFGCSCSSPSASPPSNSNSSSSSSGSNSSGVCCLRCAQRLFWQLLCGLKLLGSLRLFPGIVSPTCVFVGALEGPPQLRLTLHPLSPQPLPLPLHHQQQQQQQQQQAQRQQEQQHEQQQKQQQEGKGLSLLAQQLPPSCWLPPEKRGDHLGGEETAEAGEEAASSSFSSCCLEEPHQQQLWGAAHLHKETEATAIWGAGICLVAFLLLLQNSRQQQQQQQQREFKREAPLCRWGSKGRLSFEAAAAAAAAAAADELLLNPGESQAMRRRRSCCLPEGLLQLQQQEGFAAAAASQELVEACEETAAGDDGRLPASLLEAAAAGAAPFMEFDRNGHLSSSSLEQLLPQLRHDPLLLLLLQQLLHASPRARLSLDAALQHPWLEPVRQDFAATRCNCSSSSSGGECGAAQWLAELAKASQQCSTEAAQGDEWLQEVLEKLDSENVMWIELLLLLLLLLLLRLERISFDGVELRLRGEACSRIDREREQRQQQQQQKGCSRDITCACRR
ncbi:hypothetical protein Esti_000203 [Eimeria stiedai]